MGTGHPSQVSRRAHQRSTLTPDLDWPEAVWQAWITFEQLHGSVAQLEDCLDRVNKARDQTNARRAKVGLCYTVSALRLTALSPYARKLRRRRIKPCKQPLNKLPMSPFRTSPCPVLPHQQSIPNKEFPWT